MLTHTRLENEIIADCATTAAAIIPPHQGKTAMGDTFSVRGANQAPVHTKPSPVFFMVNYLGKVLLTRSSTIPCNKAAHSHKEMLGAMVITNKMVDKF